MPKRIVPAPVPPGSKWCFGCSAAFPLDQFGVDRRKSDGRAHACEPCLAAKRRERAAILAIVEETYARLYAQA